MAENKQQNAPKNIFEAINQNIVDMSQDTVALFQLVQALSAKIDEIHAALYTTPEQPKRTGEETGFENNQIGA